MDARISNALAAYQNTAKLKVAEMPTQPAVSSGVSAFSNMVNNNVGSTVDALKQSEMVSSRSLVQNIPLDELAVTISNAETNLRTVVAIRDKIIQAYQDIMKMPI